MIQWRDKSCTTGLFDEAADGSAPGHCEKVNLAESGGEANAVVGMQDALGVRDEHDVEIHLVADGDIDASAFYVDGEAVFPDEHFQQAQSNSLVDPVKVNVKLRPGEEHVVAFRVTPDVSTGVEST